MRKISLLGLFACLWTLSLEQPASAWLNFKFGAGINWNWQSGGNNTLWGLFRNGQPPGYGNTCDPACMPNCYSPWNVGGCCPQQPYMMPQCPQGPWMPQQFGPSGYPGPGLPGFGAAGHYNPHEFQYFGNQPSTLPATSDPSNQAVASYNGYGQASQSNYYYPNAASGFYPYGSSSYYSPYSSSSYYYPQGGANYNYNTGYPASPYYCNYSNNNRY